MYKISLGFGSNIFLARLLTPADFGLVAMVSTVLAFVYLVQDLGLNQATIQRPQISQAQISAMFWLTTAVSLGLAIIAVLCAPVVAWFFDEPRLIRLTAAFGSLVFLGGIQSQQFALLNRELRFRAIAGIDVIVVTASLLVGVLVAWLTSSYWALFAANLAASMVSLACVWTLCDFRPSRPSFEGDFKAIVSFGSGVSGFNIVNYFSRNADNLLIGRLYGGAQLGLYDRAYRLLLFPLEQMRNPLGRIMLPLLSRLQSDPKRYRETYMECVSLMMMVAQPGLVFVTIFASDVFRILFGPHWLGAAPIFQWLGIGALQQLSTSTVGWLFLSQGRGKDYFKIGLFNAFATVASFLIGLRWGALGVAAAYTMMGYIVILPATLWSAGCRGPVGARYFAVGLLPHAVATLASSSVLIALTASLTSVSPPLCGVLAIISYAIYGLIMLAFPAKRQILGANYRTFRDMLPFFGGA